MSATLAIRKSDRAIFEPSFPDSMEKPILSREDTINFITELNNCADYYFRRLVPVKRSWWFGFKLVRNGDSWATNDESLFDVHEKKDVLRDLRRNA